MGKASCPAGGALLRQSQGHYQRRVGLRVGARDLVGWGRCITPGGPSSANFGHKGAEEAGWKSGPR